MGYVLSVTAFVSTAFVSSTAAFNNRQNITSLGYSNSAQTIWSKTYTWDKNAANLLKVNDNISNDVRSFTYDHVNRLATAQDSVQGTAAPAMGSHGSVTISGTERQTISCPNGPPCTTSWDTDSVSITVNEITASVNFGQGSTTSSVAAALASALNAANPAITASASGATVNVVSNATGGATNYPLLASPSPTFDPPDFALAASGPGLTGGADATSGGLSGAYTTDAWGNRQESGTFSFGQPFGPANQITATGYQYDLAGNLTTDGLGNSYSYDADGKMSASNGASYTRDPFGQRVRKESSAGATEYYYFAGTLLATRNPTGNQWTDYIYAGGRLIAEVPVASSDTPFYRIGDHLDSLAQKTDGAGNVLGANDFSPWGELISSSGEDRLLFTQHERDLENDSDSTLYRQYASDQGRWLSPDPYNGSYNLADPQSLNRYAYLANRPLASADSLGLFANGETDGGGDGGWFGEIFGDFFGFLFDGGGSPPRPHTNVESAYGNPYGNDGDTVFSVYVYGSGYGDQPVPAPPFTFHITAFDFPLLSRGVTGSTEPNNKGMAIALPPTDPCQLKAQNIQDLRNEILNRFQAYADNAQPFPLFGTRSRAGHIQQIGDKQTALQKALNDYRSSGCGGPGGNEGLPGDVNQVAFASLPALSPSRPTTRQLLIGGAVVVGGAAVILLAPEALIFVPALAF